MKDIYYGVGRSTVIGPYSSDEDSARVRVQYLVRVSGQQVHEIKAASYEDARRKLLRVAS